MTAIMDEDISEDDDFAVTLSGKTDGIDDALITWCSQLMVQGLSVPEIRRRLAEAGLTDSSLSPGEWKRLMRLARTGSEELRWMVVCKAELDAPDWLRLDSYQRRRRTMAKMEAVIESAHSQADTVSKLNQVSFMLAGLNKAQDSMDSMTGAKDAKPAVVVNIGYDPLEQMRTVIQEVVDVEVVDDEDGVEDE